MFLEKHKVSQKSQYYSVWALGTVKNRFFKSLSNDLFGNPKIQIKSYQVQLVAIKCSYKAVWKFQLNNKIVIHLRLIDSFT